MHFRHHGFSALAFATALLFSTAGSARSQSVSPPTISTTATGETKVAPDRAMIELSVQTRAPSATDAVAENADKQTKVIAAINHLGIAMSGISTQRYFVTPETRNDKVDQTPRVVSYLVSNTIIVDVSDIGRVGKILDAAINAGANDVSSLSMYALDTQAAYQQALSAAVANAKSAATTIAAAAGGRLGPLINLSSNSTNWPSPVMKTARMASFDAAQTPVSGGEQTVTASVSASWVFIQDRCDAGIPKDVPRGTSSTGTLRALGRNGPAPFILPVPQTSAQVTRIIAVANQKGGVGKTTTAVNLAASLAAAEQRTLLVDGDPQGNASSGIGIESKTLTASVYDILLGDATPEEAIIHRVQFDRLDVLPSTPDLAAAEVELAGKTERERIMRTALHAVRDNYDFILIDCPPSLGLITLNMLVAADALLIPLQCEYYALEGLSQLLNTFHLVQQSLNESLVIDGVLLTMFDARVNLSRQVAADAKEYFGTKVFNTIVPRNIRLAEAPSFGKPIILYDVASAGAQAYLNVATELMQRLAAGSGTPT